MNLDKWLANSHLFFRQKKC